MSRQPRRARVRALAKINVSLKVLHRRSDNYHEIRTIFQTISLADVLHIEFAPARKTSIELNSDLDIPDNLVLRAARVAMDAMRRTGRVRMRLEKRIPLGAGLAGGSSDAAAVLLALPVLAGRNLPLETQIRLASELGSDVPFFLLGGAAVGLGRGEELHPLPDLPAARGLLVMPEVSVSTSDAYRALRRGLTPFPESSNMGGFQALSFAMGHVFSTEAWAALGENDFQTFAFERYPQLVKIRRKLARLGARPVMMTGSGSSLFGIFENKEQAERARRSFRDQHSESFYLVSRGRYRRMWWKSLRGHRESDQWPPRSRYA